MARNTASDSIGVALGRIPSGICIATATHQDNSTGMLASWFQQMWAESLGKRISIEGDAVEVGPTLLPAVVLWRDEKEWR